MRFLAYRWAGRKTTTGLQTAGALFATVLLLAALPCAAADHGGAELALMQGRVDEAVATLRSEIAKNPKDGASHLLLCRAFYSEAMADPAIAECEAALQILGSNSEAQDWMGRAYGMKADHSGPLGGLNLAHKVRVAFETAVTSDPKNGAAVNDLSEFYIGAPGMVGGGLDKATALATRVEALLPQSAHRIRGLVAEKHKDYDAAEREFHAAVEVAGRPNAWVDLGQYYARRKDADKAVDALQHCLTADRTLDASMVDVASILNDIHREPKLAERTLREYLDKGTKSDAAPAFKVHVALGKMLAATGDKAGAKIEFEKALALASNYAPAKKAMQGL
jgi:tetratricopeptide (TPR) repeat protein